MVGIEELHLGNIIYDFSGHTSQTQNVISKYVIDIDFPDQPEFTKTATSDLPVFYSEGTPGTLSVQVFGYKPSE